MSKKCETFVKLWNCPTLLARN